MTHPLLDKSITTLSELIAFPTISTEPNQAIIDYLAKRLETLGAKVDIYRDKTEGKANLFATLGPDVAGGIVLSGHTDVVPTQGQPWSSAPFTLYKSEDGTQLFGRGTCDMKGFIACTLVMAEEYAKLNLKKPIHFAFTHDEETGCLGAQELVKQLAMRPHLPNIAIIGEPTQMHPIEGHKGCYEYTTRFHGLEGHSSRPDLGVNTIEFAARYITKLLSLREILIQRAPEKSRFTPPYTTLGFGRLVSGTAHNVIPNHAQLYWEMRPVQDADADFVKNALDTYVTQELLPQMQAVYKEANITTEPVAEVKGLEPMKNNEARNLIANLTGANEAGLVSFGTEAGLFQSLGLNVIVCGPGSIEQAHKADEFIETSQMSLCLDLLGKLPNHLL